jgi:DNA-binding NarL/FixJ family response regulator
MKSRIEIVEDNDVVCDGLQFLINNLSDHMVVGADDCCKNVFKDLRYDQPEVILLDFDLPDMYGIEGIQRIKKRNPEIHIVVMTVHRENEMVLEALCERALGYITKNTSHARLVDAIDEVYSGGVSMSFQIDRMVVNSFQRSHNRTLTGIETEMMEQLPKGKSYSLYSGRIAYL